MNDQLSRMMDLIAMATSAVAAIVSAFIIYRKANRRLRAFPLFFSFFGPMAITVHMVMHLIGVGFAAGKKIEAGTFSYDFRFYALLLMAGVLLVLSIQLLKKTSTYILSGNANVKSRLATCGWIILVAAPTIPFTFIGSLPVQGVLIHLLATPFVLKKMNALVRPLTSAIPKAEVIG